MVFQELDQLEEVEKVIKWLNQVWSTSKFDYQRAFYEGKLKSAKVPFRSNDFVKNYFHSDLELRETETNGIGFFAKNTI